MKFSKLKPSSLFLFLKQPPSWVLPAFLVLGILLGLHYLKATDVLNRQYFDALQRIQANPESLSKDAILILIDDPSLEQMAKNGGSRWPWTRDSFAALFVALQKGGAKIILADLVFLEPSEDPLYDSLLASYSASCPAVILSEVKTDDTIKKQIIWPEAYQKQYPSLDLFGRVAYVRHDPDRDGVLRRYNFDRSLAAAASKNSPSGEYLLRWPSNLADMKTKFPDRVLSAYGWIKEGKKIMAEASKELGDDELNPQKLAALLPKLPASPDLKVVKGKTVFVGVNAAAAYDIKTTPLSSFEPGVMYHVAAWSNLEKQNWISLSSLPVLPISVLLCTLILFLMNEKIRVGSVVLLGISLLFVILGLSWVLFQNGSWLPPADPALGILLSFSAVAFHNWQTENRHKQQVQALFGSYVSEKVLDNLLNNPDAVKLGGERKELTIYFSDLAGFTDMSEGMKPEDLLEVVNIYLDEMSPFILDNGGYLDKYIGDAIMGVFGAPEVLENHAISACKAALESRDHLLKVSMRMEAERGVKLHARIGINTGDIIVGNVGSKKKLNYTVVGDAVNLASRLEGANKEFGTTIMLGENTAALLDGRFAIRPLELLRVKGKKKPVQTFELYEWTEKLSPAQKDLLAYFREGYAAYQQRNFATACDKFNIACKIDNVDNLSLKYAERCAEYLAQPPPSDWDGVFVMTKK